MGYGKRPVRISRRQSFLSARLRLSEPPRASVGTLGGIVFCASLLLSGPAGLVSAQTRSETEKSSANAGKAAVALANLQDAFASIADELEPAVVTILSTKSYRTASDSGGDPLRGMPSPFGRSVPHRSTGTGSGVIISKDGWILTNDHVVGGADKVTVKLHDGREFTGMVRSDRRSDLALVKIDASTPLPTARLGNSDAVKTGHWAIAIGSPYRYEGSFSVGVISSLYRRQVIDDFSTPGGGRFYPNMLQTDAAINPGNSGGPLCNINGEVIGINTAIESEGGGSVGIGFAIPINAAKFVIAQLLAKGHVSYGYLGVDPTTVTPRLALALKVEEGALIEAEPISDSPAAKAGLQAGDVVTAIDTRPVHNELDLRTIVAQTPPGTTIEMTVVRDGHKQALKALLTEAPAIADEKPSAPGKTQLGIEVQPLTEKLAERAGVSAKTPGVYVKSIDPSSSAADVEELAEGVVILKVNDTETPTVQAFQSATANVKSGDQVRILFQFHTLKKFVVVSVD